jgi:regulator of protease activity HflC (stomatin/prohibitin superfamily)
MIPALFNRKTFLILAGVLIVAIAGLAVGCPPYNVWAARMEGEAELARAEQNRQIQIAQSRAKAEAATYEAQAEIARAQGVAQANTIIGNSLKGNEAYLRYLWIDRLDSTKGQIIYVPTEAGLPILEAGRHPEPSRP